MVAGEESEESTPMIAVPSCQGGDYCAKDGEASPLHESKKKSPLFGDLVQGITNTAFLPFYTGLCFGGEDERSLGCSQIVFLFAVSAVLFLAAWYKSNLALSYVANITLLGIIVSMNAYRWPHAEFISLPQFFWSLMMLAGNRYPQIHSLSLGFIFMVGMLVVLLSGCNAEEVREVFPFVLLGSFVYTVFILVSPKSNAPLSGQASVVLLSAGLLFHSIHELFKMLSIKDYALTGGFNMIRTGFFATCGFLASSALQIETTIRKRLESLVAERTKELLLQNRNLMISNLAVEASDTAVAISDSSDCIVWANAALLRFVGSETPDVLGHSVLDLLKLQGDGQEKLRAAYAEENGAPPFDVKTLEEGDDKAFHVLQIEVRRIPRSSAGFGVDHRISIIRDITTQWKLEEAKLHAHKEQLSSKLKTDTMQALSHELRTPLQGIMGVTSMLLLEPSPPEEQNNMLTMIMASSRLLLTLINNMLDLRKIEMDQLSSFKLSPVPLLSALNDAKDFSGPFAMQKNVHVKILSAEECPALTSCVMSSPLRLQQILINLVSNSIKYSKVGATVELSSRLCSESEAIQEAKNALCRSDTSPTGEEGEEDCHPVEALDAQSPALADKVIIVKVRDGGGGIPEQESYKVFKKFSQLSNAEQLDGNDVGHNSGSGLGLNLCVNFIKRMKGRIWMDNIYAMEGDKRIRVGSTFSFYLRAAEPAKPDVLKPPHYMNSMRSASMCGSADDILSAGFRVLLVDDTIINLKIMKHMLMKLGVSVEAVSSGAQALAYLRLDAQKAPAERINLILTDVQMPDLDGMALSREILGLELGASQPLIIGLTADTSPETETECLRAGMSKVLHKPCTTSGLKSALTQTNI